MTRAWRKKGSRVEELTDAAHREEAEQYAREMGGVVADKRAPMAMVEATPAGIKEAEEQARQRTYEQGCTCGESLQIRMVPYKGMLAMQMLHDDDCPIVQ